MEKFKTVQDVLSHIQRNLSVPKGRENKFGGYKYRNAEDILDAVKEALPEGATIRVSDELVLIGDRYYIKATACLKFSGECECCDGFAREPESKKGMDEAQVTGATSSYARKYALCGLFSIDDGQDADAMDNREPSQKKPTLSEKVIIERLTKAETVTALSANRKAMQDDINLYKATDKAAWERIIAAGVKRKEELDAALKAEAERITKETQARSKIEEMGEGVDSYMKHAAPLDNGVVLNDEIPF